MASSCQVSDLPAGCSVTRIRAANHLVVEPRTDPLAYAARMSREGLQAAGRHGAKLPAFPDLAAAERVLLRERDELLRTMTELSRRAAAFRPDGSPESLRHLERWYFELLEGGGFASIGTDEETFERATAMYFGEVLVRNVPPFEWFVAEFAFEPGRYEIGIRRPQLELMLHRLSPAPRERNARQQSIWRRYRQASR